MTEETPLTPVEEELGRRRRRRRALALFAVALIVGYFVLRLAPQVPAGYIDDRDHFKYGSIGSEPQNGIPYWIWKVLPTAFPHHLPKTYNDAPDYRAFGFVHEEGRDTPIGFSKRRVYGIDVVGLNCAVCHTGTIRARSEDEPRIVLGMPANTMDLQSYFNFAFACAADERFTADVLLGYINNVTKLDPLERIVYKQAIPQLREGLLRRSQRLSYLEARDEKGNLIRPRFGPGRVDTFNPYKAIQFHFPMKDDRTIGTVDLPSLWNQKIREGMQLHWDGNNDKVEERNKSAALGAGATPTTLDLPRMARIERWIETLPPPRFVDFFGTSAIDEGAVARGKPLYQRFCGSCHDPDYEPPEKRRVGTVFAIGAIGTDPHRLDSFTPETAAHMSTIGAGQPWRFHRFRKTFGYAASPLDGIWARAPYLHNGAVPTMWELLQPDDKRSQKVFYRGDDVYDVKDLGFRSHLPRDGERRFFPFDPTAPGNGNRGHTGEEYGTHLPDAQKRDLLEFLKTL